jgi:hypothetical protein
MTGELPRKWRPMPPIWKLKPGAWNIGAGLRPESAAQSPIHDFASTRQ